MKLVPIFKCRDLARTLAFYTEILDFQLADPNDTSPVRWIVHGDCEIQLSTFDGVMGIPLNVHVDDVDARFARYRARGLDPSSKPQSPVHQGPLDQSWGWREFYVDDPDGNTLRFRQPIT
jgi:catechol 2,3-dioxygenase-like lactoylglutathione lyase family enzyme